MFQCGALSQTRFTDEREPNRHKISNINVRILRVFGADFFTRTTNELLIIFDLRYVVLLSFYLPKNVVRFDRNNVYTVRNHTF